MPWKKLLAWATGQIDDAAGRKAEFVLENNRIYRALPDRHSPHWRLNDAERKVLAEKGKQFGKLLGEVITIVQPATPPPVTRKTIRALHGTAFTTLGRRVIGGLNVTAYRCSTGIDN